MTPPISERTPENYWKSGSRILGVLIVGLLGWYLYANRDVFDQLVHIGWQQVIGIVLLDLVAFLLNSLLDKSILNRIDPSVSLLDSYLLQYAANFLNKVLPTIGGGAVFRAVFLKKKYGFPYSKFVSTIAGLYVISFLAVSLVGIACLITICAHFGLSNWAILAAFLALALSCLFVILFAPTLRDSDQPVLRFLKSAFDGWRLIRNDARVVLMYVLFSISLLSISAVQLYVAYSALGAQADLLSMLFLSTLGIILLLLNFTPDGLGVREVVYAFSAALVRMPPDILVLGSLVLRGISMGTTLILGGVSYFVLLRQLRVLQRGRNKLGA